MPYLIKTKTRFILLTLFLLLTFSSCGGSADRKDRKNNSDGQKLNAAFDHAVPEPDLSGDQSDLSKERDLRNAALEGNTNIVESLISSNTNINSSEADDRTALMLAAFNGHTRIMSNLIEAGAKIDLKDEFGRTALMYASTGPFSDAVKLLLENGADPNIVDDMEQFSPLMFAAAEGQLEVVTILLANGADPSLKDKDDESAETFARQNGHNNIADLLSQLN